MASNLQTVQLAKDIAEALLSESVVTMSQTTLAHTIDRMHQAGNVLTTLSLMVEGHWNNLPVNIAREKAWTERGQGLGLTGGKVPTPTEKPQELFPSFNDWHVKKYTQTFDSLWARPGMPIDVMMKALSVEMRQYLGEFAAHVQEIRPEKLDHNLSPWNSESGRWDGKSASDTVLADARSSSGRTRS